MPHWGHQRLLICRFRIRTGVPVLSSESDKRQRKRRPSLCAVSGAAGRSPSVIPGALPRESSRALEGLPGRDALHPLGGVHEALLHDVRREPRRSIRALQWPAAFADGRIPVTAHTQYSRVTLRGSDWQDRLCPYSAYRFAVIRAWNPDYAAPGAGEKACDGGPCLVLPLPFAFSGAILDSS